MRPCLPGKVLGGILNGSHCDCFSERPLRMRAFTSVNCTRDCASIRGTETTNSILNSAYDPYRLGYPEANISGRTSLDGRIERAATRMPMDSLGNNIASTLNLVQPKSVANTAGHPASSTSTTISVQAEQIRGFSCHPFVFISTFCVLSPAIQAPDRQPSSPPVCCT